MTTMYQHLKQKGVHDLTCVIHVNQFVQTDVEIALPTKHVMNTIFLYGANNNINHNRVRVCSPKVHSLNAQLKLNNVKIAFSLLLPNNLW